MSPEVEELWNIVAVSCEDLPQAEEDAARMNSVLAQRHTDSRHFFKQWALIGNRCEKTFSDQNSLPMHCFV
jgi:hypothetical protein